MKPGNQSTRAKLVGLVVGFCPFLSFFTSSKEGREENNNPYQHEAGSQLSHGIILSASCAHVSLIVYNRVGNGGKHSAFPTLTLAKVGLGGIPQRCPLPRSLRGVMAAKRHPVYQGGSWHNEKGT